MASSGLKGPYTLDNGTVDLNVKSSAGAYALGEVNSSGTFLISYIGRSDGDLKARLKNHVGKYATFKYDHMSSPKAAYEKECNLFHDFGETKLDIKIHPDRPNEAGWRCPRCGI